MKMERTTLYEEERKEEAQVGTGWVFLVGFLKKDWNNRMQKIITSKGYFRSQEKLKLYPITQPCEAISSSKEN